MWRLNLNRCEGYKGQSNVWSYTHAPAIAFHRSFNYGCDFDTTGKYRVWVRCYGVYSSSRFLIKLDEKAIKPSNRRGGARFCWRDMGTVEISKEQHHVNLDNIFQPPNCRCSAQRLPPGDKGNIDRLAEIRAPVTEERE